MKTLRDDLLKELLDYDPLTGAFHWKARDVRFFKSGKQTAQHNCAIWNGRFAGKRAGKVTVRGYRAINIKGKCYAEHRLAFLFMTGSFPTADVDHKNLDGFDNRWSNLREATRSQNHANKNGKDGKKYPLPKGVHPYWTRHGRKGECFIDETKFRAAISVDRVQIHLGLFRSIKAAQSAYAAAAQKYFGEFARS